MINICGFACKKPGDADLSAPPRSIEVQRKSRDEIPRTGVRHGSASSTYHQNQPIWNPNSGDFQENWTE